MNQGRRKAISRLTWCLVAARFSSTALFDARTATSRSQEFELMVCPASSNNPRNGEGAIVELRNGHLLLAYTEFYTTERSDHAPARICGKLSKNRGRSWGKAFEIVSNEGECNVMCVSLLRLSSGRLLMAYLKKDTEATQCQPWLRFSDDEAKSWSKPWHASAIEGYLVKENDRVIQLTRHGGRLLMPLGPMTPLGPKDPYHSLTTCIYSDDEGKTWTASKTVLDLEAVHGLQEPVAVELMDGKVMMFSRTSKGHPYRTFSADAGATWSPPEPVPDLVAPVSPQQIKRIPSTGDLLVIYNNNFEPNWADQPGPHGGRREPLTAAISKDDGKTWGLKRNIETHPTHMFDYASITFLRDEVLLTYHETEWMSSRQTDWRRNLKLKILPVSWFYKG